MLLIPQKKDLVEMCPILTALNQKLLQDIKKFFEDVHFDVKIYWISPATLWNSMTISSLTHIFLPLSNWLDERCVLSYVALRTYGEISPSNMEERVKA